MGNKHGKGIPKKDLDYLLEHSVYEKRELMKCYKAFMKMHPDGLVTKDEFKKTLDEAFPDHKEFMPEMDADFVGHCFRITDKDRSGKIDFRELMMMFNLHKSLDIADKLEWVFDLYDIDGNGTVEKKELLQMYKSFDDFTEERAEQYVEKMIKECKEVNPEFFTKDIFISMCLQYPHLIDLVTGPGDDCEESN